MTPLQVWTRSVFALLADARDELSDEEYIAFVYVVSERIRLECVRLLLGEATRAKRGAA